VGIDTPSLDARLLLEYALGITREQFILEKDLILSGKQLKDISLVVKKRLGREPVSRILGEREFWSMPFALGKDTLDPRPDSETLIEQTLLKLGERRLNLLRILDLGTGTGCLLLSLLSELANSTGVGVDISKGAVEKAGLNARNLNMSDRCQFINSSWGDMNVSEKFDIVISNPPYIPSEDIECLEDEVKRFDPYCALSGGDDGLECYRQIAKLIPDLLADKGVLILEIGFNQAEQVLKIFDLLELCTGEVFQDLAGNDRCLIWQRK